MPYILNEIGTGTEWDQPWDELVGNCASSGFMQSSAWGEFKRIEGFETPRYGLFESLDTDNGRTNSVDNIGSLVGGGMLLDYRIHGAEGLLVCPEGPIVPWEDTERARDSLRLLSRAAEERANISGGLGLRIEPRIASPRPSLLRNWSRAPVDLNPAHSLVINLKLNNDQLKSQMHPKGRYNIGVSQKHGVKVTRSTSMRDLQRFYTLFIDTATRNGFFAEPYGFFLNLASVLFPKKMAEIYFAEYNGLTLAAVIIITFGRRATYLYGGSSPFHRNVMPTYAIHWDVMQSSRQRGCVEYDLYGIDPYDHPDHPYAGFSRYKKQFGGNTFDALGAHDLIFYDRLADRVADRLIAAEKRF